MGQWWKRLWIGAWALGLGGTVLAQPPEDVARLRSVVRAHQPEAMRLLKELVEIPSPTLDVQGVHAVGERLRIEWDRLGFKTYWSDLPADLNRSGTLFAVKHTGRHPRILLLGHLDVSPGSFAQRARLTQDNGRLKGPGVLDAKGGDVVMWAAIKAMKTLGWLDNLDVTVALTGDEEKTGQPTTVSRASLRSIAQNCDMVFEFEWATHPQKATVARRGIGHFRLDVTASTGHSSHIFGPGYGAGAVFEAARLIENLRKQLAFKPYISINPNWVGMGNQIQVDVLNLTGTVKSHYNAIPAMAVVLGDFRYLTWDEKELIEKTFSRITEQALPETTSTMTFVGAESPPMPLLSANRTLLRLLSEASQDLGYGAMQEVEPNTRGASDLNYIADIVPAQLGGLGPVGVGAHSADEYAELASFPIATERFALLLRRLTADDD